MINGGLAKKIEQRNRHKRKLKKIYRDTDGCKVEYHCPEDNEYDWYYIHGHSKTITKPYYQKNYWGKDLKKFCKKRTNEIFRHSNPDDYKMKGNSYKRVFDMEWELW